MDDLESFIRVIPNFPQPGILFRDISPLLRDYFRATIDLLIEQFDKSVWAEVDAIVGIESRGFILASGLAYAMHKGLLMVRKPGKLPPPHHSVNYSLEYGQDTLQMSSCFSAQKVLVVDDVLATGGTLLAACELCERAGHTVQGVMTLINLRAINDFRWKGMQAKSPFCYD